MKRKILLMMSFLAVMSASSQTCQQTRIVLDSVIPKDKSMAFEATTSIKLLKGFYCNPDKNKTVKLTIDRYSICPPEEGITGGPWGVGGEGAVGALPGKLEVNDFGAAVYSLPLILPEGFGTMTPQIAVTYNSQAGNGLLGWGWDVSGLSSITRTGKTKYHDGTRSAVGFVDDRFLLDGKRLLVTSGDYGGNGSVYKTEVDEMSKIVSYTDGYNGSARFVVYKKDGTIWEYGCTEDSRVEPQNRNDAVLKWLVNRITDSNGNYIAFNYIENQSVGESYVSRIDYSLNDIAGISSMYRIEFVYDDREDVETGYVYGNVVTNGRLLKNLIVRNMMTGSELYNYSFDYLAPGTYSTDFKFMYYRLGSIGLKVNDMSVNPTVISWNNNNHYADKFLSYPLEKTMFNNVPFVGDFNGDGYSDVITVPYKISNSYLSDVQAVARLNNGDGSFQGQALHTFVFDKTLEWIYVVDFNGDGLDDVVPYFVNNEEKDGWKSKVQVYINNGNSFSLIGEKASNKFFIVYPADFCAENKTVLLLDDNHDGYSYNPCVLYSNGSTLLEQYLDYVSYYARHERITVADFDGDGSLEIMCLTTDKASVLKLKRENNRYVLQWSYNDTNFTSTDFLFPGDYNGDGYTDLLEYDERTYWHIAFSDGCTLKTPVSCLNNNLLRGLTLSPQDRYLCSLENLSMPSVAIRAADFDGDGKTDVGVFKNSGGNHYLQIGFKFKEDSSISYGFCEIRRFYLNINYSHQYVHLGNFLGRENISVLGSVRTNPYNTEIPRIVSLNPHFSKYSVERISDGLGNKQGFAYEYLMPYKNFYDYEYKWVDNTVRTIAIHVQALLADTVFSTNNNPCVTRHSYKNMLYHTEGHGSLGFERSEDKALINNVLYNKAVLEKDIGMMGDNYMAMPRIRLRYNYNNQIVESEFFDYDKSVCYNNDKVFMPLLITKKTVSYDCDDANAVIKTKIETFDYQSDIRGDSYVDIVNVCRSAVGVDENYNGDDVTSCSYWEQTDFEYDNRVSEWIVARVKKTLKSKHYADNDAVGACEIFEYYGSSPYLITKRTSLPNVVMDYSDHLKTVTEYSYDAVGHAVMQVTTSPSSKNQKVLRCCYGEEYGSRFPTSVVNENELEVIMSYDADYGIMLSSCDYNKMIMNYNSDPLEINVEQNSPDGMRTVSVKRWAAGYKDAPLHAVYCCWEKTSGYAETITFFDKTGKKLRAITSGLNGEEICTDFAYDDRGNMVSESLPYYVGDTPQVIYYIYDANNRLVEEIYPDGTVKYHSYNKLEHTVITETGDGKTHTVVEKVNPSGWRVQTVDIGGNTINYTYFSDGKLKSTMICDNPQTQLSFEYDNRRNLSKKKDPAYGEVSFEYNAYGELKKMITANHSITTYNYDNMGNLLERAESDENGNNRVSTHWIYEDKNDKIGTLSKIIYDDAQVITYDYDDLLRIKSVSETINGKSYTTTYTYDGANREKDVVYPSGYAIQKRYSNSGHYRSMLGGDDGKVLWQAKYANAQGNITDFRFGNGLETNIVFDEASNRLRVISTTKNDVTYQKLSYDYDGLGNLVMRTDENGVGKCESFSYDSFDRLVEIRLNDVVTGMMEYDQYGNIISKTIDGRDVYYDAHYDNMCPYAVSKVKTDIDDLSGLYQNIDYNVFGKMVSISDGTNSCSLQYGFDHERVRYVEDYDGKHKEKVYVNDCEYVSNNDNAAFYTYLRGPLGVFAVCLTDDYGNNEILYVHKDNLDSWCVITDDGGAIVQKTSYDAWGNPRNYNTWNGAYTGGLLCDRGFTGHEHMQPFGIINMNGRAYDPLLSMMMSPDNYLQSPDFSQNYNRYSYCYNNPLSYSDPTGEWIEWLLYGVFNGFVNVMTHIDDIDSFEEGVLSFGAGFVSGCLGQGLSGCSWVLQVAGNVVGAALETGANSFVRQNSGPGLDWSLLDDGLLKNDVLYAVGSSLATSVMTANIVKPTEKEVGKSLGDYLCKDKYNRMLMTNATAKMAGNLFSGRNIFDGFCISMSNIGDVLPYVRCVAGMFTDDIGFEGSCGILGNVFDKMLNFDASAKITNCGNTMNRCYSMMHSLFFKT